MEDENPSDGSVEEDTILERHRKEKKELLAEIQKIRHGISKNDKKKKKESQEQIARLESELKEKHEKELKEAKTNQKEVDEVAEGVNHLGEEDTGETKESAEVIKLKKKMAKNQKRRDNKATKNKEREAALKQQELENLTGTRHLETQKIRELLAEKKLKIYEIPSDGNCLYNAVSHQLQNEQNIKLTNGNLRRQTADYMKENMENFLPFLTKLDTGDSYTPEEYEKYCEDIANTSTWAGHLEIQAVSHIFKCRIEIVQSEGPPIVLGEDYNSYTLVLPYHRHIYGLGEHYNSVVPLSGIDEKENS